MSNKTDKTNENASAGDAKAIGPNVNMPPAGTPPGELVRPWPPVYNYNPSVIIPPTQGGEITDQQIAQMMDCIRNSIHIIESATPALDPQKHKFDWTVNKGNIDVIRSTIDYAEDHPQTVSPVLDVADWAQKVDNIDKIIPFQELVNTLDAAVHNFRKAESVVAFDDFQKYYKCIKILAAEGYADAEAVYPNMKTVFARLFGKKGPRECPVALINDAVTSANKVVMDNKDALLGVLNNADKLNKNLQHTIHQASDSLGLPDA